jgi:hypothetical protein
MLDFLNKAYHQGICHRESIKSENWHTHTHKIILKNNKFA